MLFVSIALFILAALLGLYLITFVLKEQKTPKLVAFTHGPLAAIALIILIIYGIEYSPAPIASIVIFIIAALGGLTLIYKDLTGNPVPKVLAVGHGVLAIIGFLFLIAFAIHHA